MKFKVDKKFFDKVDNACFGVIIARGIDNTKKYDFIEKLLEDEINSIEEEYRDKKVKELPEIELYREAFRKLDINPNKYMCSIEALVSRTVKSKHIPNINPIVDLGNALSLKYRIPLGIHDIDRFRGNIEIRFANSDDRFVPFGGGDYDNPDVGEVIYVSGNDVKTRRWTWRQGENSKVTEKSTNLFIPIDGFTENIDKITSLQNELIDILKNKLNLEVYSGLVDKNNTIFKTEKITNN